MRGRSRTPLDHWVAGVHEFDQYWRRTFKFLKYAHKSRGLDGLPPTSLRPWGKHEIPRDCFGLCAACEWEEYQGMFVSFSLWLDGMDQSCDKRSSAQGTSPALVVRDRIQPPMCAFFHPRHAGHFVTRYVLQNHPFAMHMVMSLLKILTSVASCNT